MILDWNQLLEKYFRITPTLDILNDYLITT